MLLRHRHLQSFRLCFDHFSHLCPDGCRSKSWSCEGRMCHAFSIPLHKTHKHTPHTKATNKKRRLECEELWTPRLKKPKSDSKWYTDYLVNIRLSFCIFLISSVFFLFCFFWFDTLAILRNYNLYFPTHMDTTKTTHINISGNPTSKQTYPLRHKQKERNYNRP